MNRIKLCSLLLATTAIGLAGCNETSAPEPTSAAEVTAPLDGKKVDATGKTDVAFFDIPAEVLSVATAMRPDLTIGSAETEQRNGITYFDVEGTDEYGAEIELDIMADGDSWKVVEVQRDIAFEVMPGPVQETYLATGLPDPKRIIESDQTDGRIVFELFSPVADGDDLKTEILWADDEATLLKDEWEH